MKNIWIITDTHFGHEKIKKMGNGRPDDFEMKMLKAIHDLVKPGDTVIHLGDICIGNDLQWNQRFLDMCGKDVKKILIRGNHDSKSYSWYYARGWDHVCEIMQIRYFGKEVLLSHMPILRKKFWDTYHEPVINVHGHLHGNRNRHSEVFISDPDFNYDAAPDTHDYKPVLLKKILL